MEFRRIRFYRWSTGFLSMAVLAGLAISILPGCGSSKEEAPKEGKGEETLRHPPMNRNVGRRVPTGGLGMSLEDIAAFEAMSPYEKAQQLLPVKKIDRDPSVWPMWGGAADRNMVNPAKGINFDFNLEDKGVLWTTKLGSQTYGNAIVSGGKVLVGTNNGAGIRPKYKADDDKGVLLCFDSTSGKFSWQLTRDKLPSGRVNDWPLQGICSAPVVSGNRLWVVTNRCELMCLDLNGFHDGNNDGTVVNEVDTEKEDADIIWSLDMYKDLNVFPHNLATSSPVLYGDYIYILTSNGVDEAHLEVPAPDAPCFLAVHKDTGKVVFKANPPKENILHGQWGSPAVGKIGGVPQAVFPGGDGWVYSYHATTFELLWKFDLNPKDTKWELGGSGSRNSIIATPVIHNESVVIAVGQDPEHGEGVGHLWRIDGTLRGDISAELGKIGEPGKKNPKSGAIWHYGGAGEDGEPIFRRTMSTVAIHNGLVFAADLSGFVHCVDFKTGKRYWVHDLMSAIWGSPLYVDGKVMIGDEDGRLTIFDAGKDYAEKRKLVDAEIHKLELKKKKTRDRKERKEIRNQIKKIKSTVAPVQIESESGSAIYSTPTIANGVLFLTDRAKLYAVELINE